MAKLGKETTNEILKAYKQFENKREPRVTLTGFVLRILINLGLCKDDPEPTVENIDRARSLIALDTNYSVWIRRAARDKENPSKEVIMLARQFARIEEIKRGFEKVQKDKINLKKMLENYEI